MSKPRMLNVFIAKRLISAAVNIFGIEEKWIAQYQQQLAAVTVEIMAAVEKTIEQELSRSKEENERLRRLLLELGAVNPDCSAAHSEIIVSVDEDESEEVLSELKTLKSRRTQAEKRQSSQVCPEAKTTSELKEPLKSHTTKTPFKCPVCSKRYKTLGGF
ncbi:unnamed protein product [Coregonus sp. 'balchen']|nr:unnamed protein product [Coregonus sp. 'balchen']